MKFVFIFAIIITIFSSKNIKCFNDINSNGKKNVQEQNNNKGDGNTSTQENQNVDEVNSQNKGNVKEGEIDEMDEEHAKQYNIEIDSEHNNNELFQNDTNYVSDESGKDYIERDPFLFNDEQMDKMNNKENMHDKPEQEGRNSNNKKNSNKKEDDEYNKDLIHFEKEFREIDDDSGDNSTIEDIGLNLKNDTDKNMNKIDKNVNKLDKNVNKLDKNVNKLDKNYDQASQNGNVHNKDKRQSKQGINKNNKKKENHDWKRKVNGKEDIPHNHKNEMLLGKEHESIKYFFEILTEIFIIIKLGIMDRYTNYLIPLKNIIIHKTLNKMEFVCTTILWLHKVGSEQYRDTYGFILIILFILALKYIIKQTTFKIKKKTKNENGVFKNKSNENIYIENLLKRILYKVERKNTLEFEDNNNINILQHILENTDNILINSNIINKENKTIYTDMTSNINNIGVFTYVSTQALKKINYKTDVIINELTGGRAHGLGDIPDDNKTDSYKNLTMNEYDEYDMNKMKENFVNYNEYDENYVNNKLGYNMIGNHNEFSDIPTSFIKKNNNYPFINENSNMIEANNMAEANNMIYSQVGEDEMNYNIGTVVNNLGNHIDKNINDNIDGNHIIRNLNSSNKIPGNQSPYSTEHPGIYDVISNSNKNNTNEYEEDKIHSFHLKNNEEDRQNNSPFISQYLKGNQKTGLIETNINNSLLNQNDKISNSNNNDSNRNNNDSNRNNNDSNRNNNNNSSSNNGTNNLVNPNEEMENISAPPYRYSQNVNNNNMRDSKEHINNYSTNFMHNKKSSVPLNENISIRDNIQENSNYLIQSGESNRESIVPDLNNEEIMTNSNIISNYENRSDLVNNNLSNKSDPFLNERENGIKNLENENFVNKQNTFPNHAPPPFSYVTPPQQYTDNISSRNSKHLTQRKERQEIIATKSPFN
ncbi:hypothetical protein YYC_02306 [Plasmodium yoelii 17X]|uniref:Secreted ookinete protein n=1 Tax=Plasmodium yoelii 17X TaxID=1323249 RepID=V7PP08_PLAYE|nr:hypothetical protein YYC_02306 [Plasmodium yoelii 17X]